MRLQDTRLSGEGKGGIAGFAKGGADVALEEVEGGTKLTIPPRRRSAARLPIGLAPDRFNRKKLADQFFSAFAEKLGG
ncbi:MAG: hypothetical protein R3D29_01650 [Nitratireductor sp.]